VVVDTNVVVAAGFAAESASAAILDAARAGRIELAWNARTRDETRSVVARIPPLDEDVLRDLFRDENACQASLRTERFEAVPDPADRVFAALADAAGAVLVSNDDDLLGVRDRIPVTVMTPSEFAARHVRTTGG